MNLEPLREQHDAVLGIERTDSCHEVREIGLRHTKLGASLIGGDFGRIVADRALDILVEDKSRITAVFAKYVFQFVAEDEPKVVDAIKPQRQRHHRLLFFHIDGTLPAGRFVRIAVLGPRTPRELRLQAEMEFGPSAPLEFTYDSLSLYYPRQADTETIEAGEYDPVSFLERRGTPFDVRYPIFKTDGTPRPSLALMPPLAEQLAVPDIVVIDSALR